MAALLLSGSLRQAPRCSRSHPASRGPGQCLVSQGGHEQSGGLPPPTVFDVCRGETYSRNEGCAPRADLHPRAISRRVNRLRSSAGVARTLPFSLPGSVVLPAQEEDRPVPRAEGRGGGNRQAQPIKNDRLGLREPIKNDWFTRTPRDPLAQIQQLTRRVTPARCLQLLGGEGASAQSPVERKVQCRSRS